MTESRNVARIRHANVVRVRRCFKRNGTAYMVMDYEEGVDLQAWLRDLGRLPTEAEVQRITAPLLDGLQAVHAVGLVHRDIKPQNIFIRDGDGSPVLLDFGAARLEDASHFTTILTAGYAPIEQYEEEARQGPWTDIYGLAAVLYRAITGTKPQAALNRVAMDRLVPVIEACRGNYSNALLRGIDHGLRLAPEDRPRSIAEWRAGWLEPSAPVVAVTRPRPATAAEADATLPEARLKRPPAPAAAATPSAQPAPKPVPPPPAATLAAAAPAVAAPPAPAVKPSPAAPAPKVAAVDEDEDEVDDETINRAAPPATVSPSAVGRVIEIPAVPDPHDDDSPRRFDLMLPSWSVLALLGFLAFIDMAVATIILRKVFQGNGLVAVPLAALLTFGLSLAFARASREINWYSCAVWGGAATLVAIVLIVVLFGRFVF